MPEALTRDVPQLERQIEPRVVSQATPEPQDLLEVRAEIQSTPRLQALFRRAHEEKWSADHLADLLTTELNMARVEGNIDPTNAARYLADEYTQIGPQGIQLINTSTGRIAAIIREEDIYQPAPVPREGSTTLAKPLPRIRPDLEAAIVTWFHDKGREERVVEALAARGHQTALLREMGDPRLLVATRKGRRHIVAELAKLDPKLLLESAGGTAGTFLRLFTLVEALPPEIVGGIHLSGEVSSESIMKVQDQLTVNLQHNRAATLRGALVAGWIRRLAAQLSHRVHQQGESPQLDISEAARLPGKLWVGPPDLVRPFYVQKGKVSVLPVEASGPLLIKEDSIGFLRVPKAFEAMNQEIFERWEASACLDFEMWVDPSKVAAYDVTGFEVVAQVL